MEKYIDMTVREIRKSDLKDIFLEAGLKGDISKRNFLNKEVSVSVKELGPFSKTCRNYNLGISAENINKAAEVYNLILNKKDEISRQGKYFYIKSNLYTDKTPSGTGTGMGVSL
jgi:hypothetical protein